MVLRPLFQVCAHSVRLTAMTPPVKFSKIQQIQQNFPAARAKERAPRGAALQRRNRGVHTGPRGRNRRVHGKKNDPRLLISRLTRKVRLGKPRPPRTRSVSRDGRTVMLPSPLAQPLSLRPRPICYLDGILSSTVELHSYNMRTCLHESLNQGPGGSIARQARTVVSYTTRHVYYATPRCLGPSHPDTNAWCAAMTSFCLSVFQDRSDSSHQIVGFHDATRLATIEYTIPRCLGPSHPDTKGHGVRR